jgi:hypothetical protein
MAGFTWRSGAKSMAIFTNCTGQISIYMKNSIVTGVMARD